MLAPLDSVAAGSRPCDHTPMADLRSRLLVEPGRKVRLEDFDTSATHGHDKADSARTTAEQLVRLGALQDRFWAEAKRSVLVVLQGIDAAGKDGTVKHVMTGFNPAGVSVASFKVPTPVELAHDYLWRVHDLVPKAVWSKRYDEINAFERHLADNGTTVVKFFLSISKDEQRARFQARYDDPTKRWKFSMGDLEERKHWDDYQRAFDDVLSKTSTTWAPWYVIPADRKWFRDVAVSTILADILDGLDPAYPAPADLPTDLVIE